MALKNKETTKQCIKDALAEAVDEILLIWLIGIIITNDFGLDLGDDFILLYSVVYFEIGGVRKTHRERFGDNERFGGRIKKHGMATEKIKMSPLPPSPHCF